MGQPVSPQWRRKSVRLCELWSRLFKFMTAPTRGRSIQISQACPTGQTRYCNASPVSLTSTAVMHFQEDALGKKKKCPPCWNIKGLCPDASLINYERAWREESGRHKDGHLCSIVRRVITFMDKKERHPGRPEAAHRRASRKHIETDKSNKREEVVLAGTRTYKQQTKTGDVFVNMSRQVHWRLSQRNGLMASPIPCWVAAVALPGTHYLSA